jgi:hypothetical protein
VHPGAFDDAVVLFLTNFPATAVSLVDNELFDVFLTSQSFGKDHTDLRNDPEPRRCEKRATTRQRPLALQPLLNTVQAVQDRYKTL